jgi:hypothetical protein
MDSMPRTFRTGAYHSSPVLRRDITARRHPESFYLKKLIYGVNRETHKENLWEILNLSNLFPWILDIQISHGLNS